MTGLPQPAPTLLRFGVFVLDVHVGELHRNGWKIKLDGQPLAILRLLLQRPGEVVSRDELRQQLWPADTYVDFEHSINAAVKRLRRSLQDSATKPRFIETLPRRGYRFVYPVGEEKERPAGTAASRLALRPAVAPARNVVRIDDVARDFGVSVTQLRQYEQEGLLIPLRLRSRRYFSDHDYRWICTLLHLVRKDRLNFEGIRRLLALLPCWQIRGCQHRRKQGCPFIKNALAPCWTNKHACCDDGQSCYSCAVYRSAPECENLKLLLAHSNTLL